MAIKSYKGFDKNLRCRDFQYKIGGIYEMDGEIKVCNRGFHACESPFDVFDYYTMIDSRFCEVEQDGNISKEDRGTKICSSKIKIKAELKLADMINLGIEWLKEITLPEKIKTSIKDNSSGNYAKIGSSGDDAKIGSSGDGAKIGSFGDGAKIGSSGNNAKIDSTGKDCVIMCAGINPVAKASKGSWITLSEWSYSEGKQRYIPICVKTEFVDGEKIKADTYYSLKGEFLWNGSMIKRRCYI